MANLIDPSTKFVFCEGQQNSLDSILLSNIFPLGEIYICPVGGKHSMPSFVDGYLERYTVNKPQYIGFRDRDFDVEPPEKPGLIKLNGKKPIWLTYFACIESYIVDSHLIFKYWTEREDAPGWTLGKSPSLDHVESKIYEVAKEISNYESVRWGLSKIKPCDRWPEVKTSWTAHGSGDLPASLSYDDCLAKAVGLVQGYQQQSGCVTPECLSEYSNSFREKFTKEEFFINKEFMLWFHGKDMFFCLCKKLATNFPRKNYSEWAVANLDISQYPELQQLRNAFVRETDE
jgi:hypothetical protein